MGKVLAAVVVVVVVAVVVGAVVGVGADASPRPGRIKAAPAAINKSLDIVGDEI